MTARHNIARAIVTFFLVFPFTPVALASWRVLRKR